MKENNLPIKFFAPRDIDELRVEPGGGNEDIPKWVLQGEELKKKADVLMTELDEIQGDLKKHFEKGTTIPYVFIAKMNEDATAKSKRKDVSELFQVKREDRVIGLNDNNHIIVRMDTIEEMKIVSNRVKEYEKHNYAISCLEEFQSFTPRFEQMNEIGNYKVKLIDFQDYEQNVAIERMLEQTLQKKDISYSKIQYAENYTIFKFRNIACDCLKQLRDSEVYEAIFSIEPMPKYTISLDTISKEDNVIIRKPNEHYEYLTVGVLDNGIESIEPIRDWLNPKRWSVYPDSSINPTHGTFVAGIILYGDDCEGQEWVGNGGINIFDAAVFPDTSKEGLDEDELIQNIKDAIRIHHDKVKIWNLSISITREVVDKKFSDFAIALDSLQDKYNVLICKSAGNCSNFMYNRPKGRIHEGADSIRSLVVGSIAHKKGVYDYAEIGDPSPFTRIGPGPEYIIKPEIAHYGGNAGVDRKGNLVTTGVRSFSKDGSISESVGTSFSTPRVTSLAATIQQDINEEFDPLLIKALILHSATYPKDMTIPVTERARQVGFGIPQNARNVLYNSPHEVTLILRDNLAKRDKIDIMDFPMPDCLVKNGHYTGQVVATLVYDPILDSSQGIEYCQSNLDIKFGSYDTKVPKDVTKRYILNPVGRVGSVNLFRDVYSKNKRKEKKDDFALKERLQIQYGDKYYPVKKYAVDLSELTDKKTIEYLTPDKKWFLYMKGTYRDHIERKAQLEGYSLSQEYCLIITIKDPFGKESVYDEVTKKLDEYNFWHSNIKISSDINLSI